MGVLALLESFELVGGRLTIESGQVEVQYPEGQRMAVTPILTRLRECREEVIRLLQDRSAGTMATRAQVEPPSRRPIDSPGIPAGAILIASRFDLKPLVQIPECWCCGTTYILDHVQDWESTKYAHLNPGCKCLDAPQAVTCCGRCLEHCICKPRREDNNRPEVRSE